MKYSRFVRFAGCGLLSLALLSTRAQAGDQPLYQAPPAWVEPAPIVDPVKAAKGSPLVIMDMQQRFEGGVAWSYVDTAIRADTPDALTQLGTLKAAWAPEKGDLIVHRAQIIRGGETIDLLKSGQFTVLRREQQLEQRQINGILTATMPVAGLQVGDIVRLSMSVTNSDKALAGKVQGGMPLLQKPVEPGFSRLRVSWPDAMKLRWAASGGVTLPESAVRKANGYSYLDVVLPLPKRDEMPKDAPFRYSMGSMLRAGTFTSWEDVSKTMAPLFATEGLIAPGGPIDKEVAAIKAATADPTQRAARALALVQDKVSYLLNGMNGGNYVPQPPAQTWELRYGDCKAKTLLLLSMLRAMDIEAEPVLASSVGGDALPDMLPLPAAFDHVLVHARIGGENLWLDGTDLGTRLADLHDTPRFFNVLPLRPQGAGLMAMALRPNARPNADVTFTVDERAGVDLPALYDVAVKVRGAQASQANTAWVQATETDRRNQVYGFIKDYIGDTLMSEWSLAYDPVAGVATFSAKGVMDAPWSMQRGRYRQTINLLGGEFAPDRARPAWRDIPAAVEGPNSSAWRTTYLLPDKGAGVTIDGDPAIASTIAGARIERRSSLADGVFTLTERADWTGVEVAPAQIEGERAKSAGTRKRMDLVAPETVQEAWSYDPAKARAAIQPIEGALAKAIAAWPEGRAVTYSINANIRSQTSDWRGALAAIDKAIAIEPSVERLLLRSGFNANLGNKAAALQDAEQAVALAPADSGAILAKADALEQLGRGDEAIALLKTQLSQGANAQGERAQFVSQVAEFMADKGQVSEAIALISDSLSTNPGDPVLLNARCWTKATRQVELDTALRDCTKAIELSDAPAAVLDSRAMVYFRLGRMDDALADLDAALQAAPGLAPSRYMRGIVRKRTGSVTEGQSEIQSALRREPTLQVRYQKYGIAP